MARVAVVTGGTRGIGAAISKALKGAGYQVAAIYAGNDEAAEKFKQVLDGYEILSDKKKRSVYDEVTRPAESEQRVEEEKFEEEEAGNSDNGFGQQFHFTQDFKQAVEPEPKCPSCSAVGTDHIVSRKGGASSSRGKQFVLAPFSVVFCKACGHVYGVTPSGT